MNINGLILAGGSSVRMGSDKALIDYHGVPQRSYLFELLSKFCSNVYTSCKASQQLPPTLHPLPDRFQIRGPFNGILSAFEHDPANPWLTVPVDMPMIDEAVISYLVAHRRPDKVATCFFDSDGALPEPLFTIWEVAAYPLLKTYYDSGRARPREFLMTHDTHVIKSPNPLVHLNVNSPEDLDAFRRHSS